MDLEAIQQAVAAIVDPFVKCYDEIPPSTVDFPCAYVSMPSAIDLNVTLSGQHMVDMPIVLCLSRADDHQAQRQLATILSSGLLDAIDQVVAPPWFAAQFINVTKFRTVKFAGGDVEVIACDINLTVRA